MDQNELINYLLNVEEWQTFECKRAAVQPTKLLETVVSFANTDGGLIVIGLEDPKKQNGKKRLIGINENRDNVSEFLKLINQTIRPPHQSWHASEIKIVNTDGNDDNLLLVKVEKSNDVHSTGKSDTFIRRGSQNVKIGSEEITRLRYEKGAIHFEDEITDVSSLENLDQDILNNFKNNTGSLGESDWQFLKDNGLAKKSNNKFSLLNAGGLLFLKNPSVILKTKSGIKISHYFGTKPFFSGEPNLVRKPFTAEGPLLNQIDEVMSYFREVVKHSPPKLKKGVFKPSILIPEWAFQEAVVNAVIHRNYAIQNDIQIRFFADRIEIESPGTYPGHITPANIRTERFSRNPILLRALNRFQEAPNLDIGEGVDRMFEVMRKKNLYEPIFFPRSIRPNSVLVVLFNLQKVEYWDVVSSYLIENFKITNKEARSITGINDTMRMSRLLKGWVNKGLLESIGKSKKGVYYKKPGQDIPAHLLSGGVIINQND